MGDQEKASMLKLSAETLKQYALLEYSNSTTRRGNEAHPKAFLSTKKFPQQPEEEAGGCCSSTPCDVTTPVACNNRRILSSRMVCAPVNCTSTGAVKRQLSTLVDPVSFKTVSSTSTVEADGYVVIENGPQPNGDGACGGGRRASRNRPKNLELKRNLSSHSSASGSTGTPGKITPCSPAIMCSPSTANDDQLVHSYPGPPCPRPGPLLSSWRQSPHEHVDGEKENCHHIQCQPLPNGNPRVVLARRIAERLKAIGDQVNTDNENFEFQELIEHYVTSMSLGQGGSWLSWRSVVQLYQTLSRLLTQCLVEDETAVPEENEPWMTFNKLWKIVLQSVVGWIMDNGGWSAFIRETDYSVASYIASSTPDFHNNRRRFTYSHSPSSGDATNTFQYSTPQTHRKPFGKFQSSPVISRSQERRGSGQERRSRVLSLTEEGQFLLDTDKEGGEEGEEEEEEERSNDEGLHMRTPSISSPDTCDNSPIVRDSPNNEIFRPHSSTLTPSDSGTGGSCFDRNRSHSFPCRKRPDNIPGSGSGGGGSKAFNHSAEVISEGESLDSGLEASSELSIASTDSMQYSTLGVSALCILEAVKSCLDHQ